MDTLIKNNDKQMMNTTNERQNHTQKNTAKKNSASIQGFSLEYESKLGFADTEAYLEKVLNTGGWKTSKVHDLQQSLQKNGQEVLPVKIMELCNPAYSGEMLKDDDMRFLSVLMPCRVSLYEKSNGKTYIGMMDTANMAKILGSAIESKILQIQNEIELKIQLILK